MISEAYNMDCMNLKKRKTNWWHGIKAIIREYPSYINCEDKLTGAKRADFEAVKKAVAQTRALRNGEMRLELIDLVFWKKSHTLSGAATHFPFCEREVQQWHADFIRQVGRNRGLID